jgi:uncharacterized protein YndB with AHSA1/START domain
VSVRHGSFTLTRRYDATPARVFAAWAIPEQRSRWNIHGKWTVAAQSFDFREGGEEMKRFGPPGGDPVHVACTRYEDIVPDKRIVMSSTTRVRDILTSVTLLTVQIEPADKGSLLRLTYQAVLLDEGDRIENREEGWVSILAKLGDALIDMPPRLRGRENYRR